ncbi:MAG: phosphate ABC transporter substrate-binding protein PstS family protein [Chloroflexi bacterium]|nr:phosphate ABC transporter substrate-binding protein PstS family protein [Chloroflexota bacterium]
MRRSWAVILVLAAVVLTSCASPAAPSQAPVTQAPATQAPPTTVPTSAPPAAAPSQSGAQLPEVNPLEVTGDIITAGSSTVFPLSERIAERFTDEGYKGNVTIDSIGSGAGLERFCKSGETDIANASRPIKDSEVESCRAINREPIEFRMGTDALAVAVSKENTFLQSLTKDELARVFSDAVKWSDINPAWPNENIQRFIPGTDSGTFDFFVEEVLGKDNARALSAANQQLSEDDNVLVQGIVGSPYAIGYFGYDYYVENADKLRVVAIEGVEPSDATVDGGQYPLARPLFIYSTAEIMKSKPQVAAFINFYLSHVEEEIKSVGYFPASSAVMEAAKAAWLEAVGQ